MRSMQSNGLVVLTILCLLAALVVPKARADEWDKKTTLTFNEPVQVPGATLPAGTYVFKLADSQSDRTIVQIFNADETKLITTILAIPDYRMKTPSKTIISFNERPSGQPEALRAWPLRRQARSVVADRRHQPRDLCLRRPQRRHRPAAARIPGARISRAESRPGGAARDAAAACVGSAL